MRKAIFIFIAIVLVAASIDWIRSCNGLKSHKEVFGRELTYADMYEYKDADYDYVVRVPSEDSNEVIGLPIGSTKILHD